MSEPVAESAVPARDGAVRDDAMWRLFRAAARLGVLGRLGVDRSRVPDGGLLEYDRVHGEWRVELVAADGVGRVIVRRRARRWLWEPLLDHRVRFGYHNAPPAVTRDDLVAAMAKLRGRETPTAEIRCGPAAWLWFQARGNRSHLHVGGDPGRAWVAPGFYGTPLSGIPIHVDATMTAGLWEYREDGRVTRRGVVDHPPRVMIIDDPVRSDAAFHELHRRPVDDWWERVGGVDA